MITQIKFHNKNYQCDLSAPLDISLPIHEGLTTNPSCYWAEEVKFETIRVGNFVGSVKEGGSVNYQKLTLTPHGNGTHTECFGHISADPLATINESLKNFHFPAELITVDPKLQGDDLIISLEEIKDKLTFPEVSALILRTSPNDESKKTCQYSGTNPPYIHSDVIKYLVEHGIQHILIDLPSLDREIDEGKLAAHKAFWKFPDEVRKQATITELIFVDNEITDGLYLLNLQIISLEMDASPSKPILYKLKELL